MARRLLRAPAMRALLLSVVVLGAAVCHVAACGNAASPSLHGATSSASTGGAGGAGVTGGMGGMGGAGTGGAGSGGAGSGGAGPSTSATGGAATVCTPPLETVAPSGTSDTTYTNQPETACFGNPCLCSTAARGFVDHVLACDPIAGGYYLGQGSLYLRVMGRSGGACIVDVGAEVEGGVTYSRCTLPLPMAPWPGIAQSDPGGFPSAFLDGIADQCQAVGQCCIESGCPDPCSSTLPAAPVCPAIASSMCQ